MRLKTLVRIAAGASVFSMLLYAFTGLHIWSSPILPDDGGRVLLLIFAHLAPLIAMIHTEF